LAWQRLHRQVRDSRSNDTAVQLHAEHRIRALASRLKNPPIPPLTKGGKGGFGFRADAQTAHGNRLQ
jgi:hypothetical protein